METVYIYCRTRSSCSIFDRSSNFQRVRQPLIRLHPSLSISTFSNQFVQLFFNLISHFSPFLSYRKSISRYSSALNIASHVISHVSCFYPLSLFFFLLKFTYTIQNGMEPCSRIFNLRAFFFFFFYHSIRCIKIHEMNKNGRLKIIIGDS